MCCTEQIGVGVLNYETVQPAPTVDTPEEIAEQASSYYETLMAEESAEPKK